MDDLTAAVASTNILLVVDDMHVSEEHVCWYTARGFNGSETIRLMEIVKRRYRHPQAPDHAFVDQCETVLRGELHRNSYEGAPVVLMEAMQMTIDKCTAAKG